MADKPVLLALDDDEEIVNLVCAIGQRAGFDAVATTAAEQFRTSLRLRPPDVIVLDLQMPEMDGVQMLRFLAEESVEAGIVLVTGMDMRTISSAEQYGRSKGLRVLATLQKPFMPEDLLKELSEAHTATRPLTASDLQSAIDDDQLVVHYQPTISLFADGSWDVASVEALLRWDHPVRGIITPDAFISMGEEHGLIGAMTDFVIQRGIEQLRGWKAMRFNLGMRVNIAASLISDIDFPDRLEAMLIEQEVDPAALTLEITETATLEQSPETTDILTRLRLKNINLAIDDFGIGYSSLTQLVRMPFSEMKIDRSLLMSIHESKESRIMVDALVELAHKLNLTVCAEGVETEKTLDFLGEVKCDAAQGYYISHPLPASEVPDLIQRWERRQQQRQAVRGVGG
jgi:EAL domain-containing protein (putative c-di-GMP-specific phosphodiesterase class I)